MSKYIDAEKLKALVKRQIRWESLNFAALGSGGQTFCINTLEWILKQIDSLQQEQQEEPDKSLEEAAEKFARFYDNGTCDGIAQDCFIAGAKWQTGQLLKGSPLPEDTVIFYKGIEEGKRLMMKEAVEADVNTYRDLAAGKSWAEFLVEMPTTNIGDKVRIIILPKEDEK